MNSDIFNQVFAATSQNSSGAAETAGQISDWLLTLGYTAQDISQLLNGVATSPNATAIQLANAQAEIQYLQMMQAQQQKTNWLPLLLIGGAIVWALRK